MLEERAEQLDQQIKAEMERISTKPGKTDDIHDSRTADEQKVDSTPETPVNSDPYRDEALKMGWKPDGKLDAQEFVERKSFFDKIKTQNKEINELKDMIKQSLDHNTKLEKATYEKALRELQNAKDHAIANADSKQVKIIEKEMSENYKQIQELNNKPEIKIEPQEVQKEISQDLLSFKERNKEWFNLDSPENKDMVEDADYIDRRIGAQLVREGRQISQAEHLALVEEQIKKFYPHRFKNDNQTRPVAVGRSTEGSDNNVKSLGTKLTAQQKAFVKRARDIGSKLTEEDYAKQLQKIGALRE